VDVVDLYSTLDFKLPLIDLVSGWRFRGGKGVILALSNIQHSTVFWISLLALSLWFYLLVVLIYPLAQEEEGG
jgi:hypothetical protein